MPQEPQKFTRPSNRLGRRQSKASGIRAERIRTTCAIGHEANRLVDVARVWLRVGDSSASKECFLDTAVVTLTRALMAANPEFKLPPGFSLESIGAIQPNKLNGGNQ